MKKKLLAIIIVLSMAVSILGSTAFAYAEMNVTVDGINMVLNSEYDSSIIPEGFYEVGHEYNGETYYGGTNDSIDLYYIRCDSDARRTGWYTLQDGNFVLYQNLDGETSIGGEGGSEQPSEQPSVATLIGSSLFSKAIELKIAEPGVGTEIPSGYSETSVAADNAYIKAYQKDDATGASTESYLIYGSIDGVNFGWYVYDQGQETIQRFMNNAEAQVVDQQENIIDDLKADLQKLNNKYNNDIGRSKNLFIIACIVAVFFLLLMINAMIKRKHVEKDLEDRIVDLKENHGEETQRFTKAEQRRFDRMDSAAKDRADRSYDKNSGGDTYNYPGYGENRTVRTAQNKPVNKPAQYDQVPDMENGSGINRDAAREERKEIRSVQRTPEKKPERAPRYEEKPRQDYIPESDNGYFADDALFEEDPAYSQKESYYRKPDENRSIYRGEYEPRNSDRRSLTRESDSNNRPDEEYRSAMGNRESLFNNPQESTKDIGMALKQARNDKIVTGESGETRDFDLDLLEKSLGKMTSDVMDSVGNHRPYEVTEISDDSDFNTDFIEL